MRMLRVLLSMLTQFVIRMLGILISMLTQLVMLGSPDDGLPDNPGKGKGKGKSKGSLDSGKGKGKAPGKHKGWGSWEWDSETEDDDHDDGSHWGHGGTNGFDPVWQPSSTSTPQPYKVITNLLDEAKTRFL